MIDVIVVYDERDTRRGVHALNDLGEFKATDFRNIIRGKVEDLESFLTKVEERILPPTFLPIRRVIPIEEWFYFSPNRFLEIAKAKIGRYLDRIGEEESFCVRLERRGMKGQLSSKDLEVEIGGYAVDMLRRKHNREPKVDLEDPDQIVVIETIGSLAGVSLISKKLRRSSHLVRVK